MPVLSSVVQAVDGICYEPGQRELMINMTEIFSGSCKNDILRSPTEAAAAIAQLGSMCGGYGVAHPYRRSHHDDLIRWKSVRCTGWSQNMLTWSKQVAKTFEIESIKRDGRHKYYCL